MSVSSLYLKSGMLLILLFFSFLLLLCKWYGGDD